MSTKKPKKGRGGNFSFGYKRNLYGSIGNILPSLDLGGVPLKSTKGLIVSHIKYRIKRDDTPFRIITHNVVDKIILLRDVCNEMNVRWGTVDTNNLGCYTIMGLKN
tara:strand:+ start:306 stop:623 length:318 start_codon:yes stop_codon:yes gene_type:complete